MASCTITETISDIFTVGCRYSLPLQLATLAVQLLMSCRLCVCRMAGSEGLQPAVQATCRGLRKAAVVAAGFLLGGIQLVNPKPQPQICSGVQAAAQLQWFSAALLLLVLPGIVVYVLELNLKVAFLRGQRDRGLLLQPGLQLLSDNALACGAVGVAVMVAVWFFCEGLVAAAGPLSCESAGWPGMQWQPLRALLGGRLYMQ